MKKFLQKHFVYILFFLFLILPAVRNVVHAWEVIPSMDHVRSVMNDSDSPKEALSAGPTSVYDSRFVMGSYLCDMFGNDPKGGLKFCSDAMTERNPNYGLIPTITNTNLAMSTNLPASTPLYLADVGHSLGFLPQAYAQGVGFDGLRGILAIWKIFRNIAYVLLALAVIVVGFMIMFRRKIDPKTVVTIQEALPRIIVSLILITFSYAIVGLMIDLLYVVLMFAYGLFNSAQLFAGRGDTQNTFLSGNMFQVMGIIFPGGFNDFGSIVERITGWNLAAVGGTISVGSLLAAFATGQPAFLVGAAAIVVIPILVQFLVGILLAILEIRIFFLFLGAYVQLMLRTIMGPLEIMMGVIPGQEGFGGWFRNVVGQLSVFAVAGIMFMLATAFMIISSNGQNQTLWQPPYMPGTGSTTSIAALFTIGILMLIPTIAAQVRQSIMSEKGKSIGVGGAIMGGFGPAFGIGLQLFNIWQTRQTQQAMRQAVGGKNPQVKPDDHAASTHPSSPTG